MIVGDLIQITGFSPRGHTEPKQGVDLWCSLELLQIMWVFQPDPLKYPDRQMTDTRDKM